MHGSPRNPLEYSAERMRTCRIVGEDGPGDDSVAYGDTRTRYPEPLYWLISGGRFAYSADAGWSYRLCTGVRSPAYPEKMNDLVLQGDPSFSDGNADGRRCQTLADGEDRMP